MPGDHAALFLKSERVAQPVEHVTFNHGVLGSSPSALTKKINGLEVEAQTERKHHVCAVLPISHAVPTVDRVSVANCAAFAASTRGCCCCRKRPSADIRSSAG